MWKVRHNLLEIVVMTICAVISGCDVWEDIADFCRVKEVWLKESLHMQLENGIPSHDTLSRVWGMICPQEFERCFRSWVSTICQKPDGEIISIDGKTVRGSGGEGKSPLHMVSAWAHHEQLVLGQIATAQKSNEITAVPNLLDVLDIAGCIITADAMNCQKEIVHKIADKGADYVLGLKNNQPNLRRDTQDYFAAALSEKEFYKDVVHTQTIEKGHGRIEVRDYYFTTDIDWLHKREEWSRLEGLGMVRTKITRAGKVTHEDRFYITSLTDVHTFAKAVRAHWGIENSLHWCLDMTFREDYSRMRKDHCAENMAVVRHMALDILKQYPEKISLARKRRRCAYDESFLAKILLSLHA
jgi:predicted transposase YbfD/YdcC